MKSPNILLTRLGGFGDVIFTLPSVHLVRTAFPDAHLSFLVAKEWSPLLEGFQGVHSVIRLDRALYRRKNPFAITKETFSLLRKLRRGRFSHAIDFQGFGETAFLTWWTGAPQRWGSVYRPARRWAYSRPVPRQTDLHPVEYHLDLLHQCGLPRLKNQNQFALPPSALEQAGRLLAQEYKIEPARPLLFIQALTSSTQKNWALENYLALARNWRARGWQVLFGGGPNDIPPLEAARNAGFAVCAGQPLLVMAGLVKLSRLVLGGDTGLLHLGVALGKPVVMLMSSLGPGSCPPFGHADWALVPAPGKSIASLSPDLVEVACTQVLSSAGEK